jgi:hypothetical protein
MKRILVVLVMLAVAGFAFAQTDSTAHNVIMNVVAVAAIDLNSTADITLNTVAPVNAGDPPTGETNNTKVLWYTALNAAGLTRIITVNWGGADAAPAGTSLSVVAVVEAGAGTAGAAITISNVAQNLVTAIPSVATGRLGTDGAALTYSFNVLTPGSLVEGAGTTVTVTYTLTNDA